MPMSLEGKRFNALTILHSLGDREAQEIFRLECSGQTPGLPKTNETLDLSEGLVRHIEFTMPEEFQP